MVVPAKIATLVVAIINFVMVFVFIQQIFKINVVIIYIRRLNNFIFVNNNFWTNAAIDVVNSEMYSFLTAWAGPL